MNAAPQDLVPAAEAGGAAGTELAPRAAGAPAPPLRGRRKAAVLLVTLGPKKAAEVFSHLSEAEIEELSLEMAKTGEIPREQIEAVLEEVAENSLAFTSIAEGGVAYAREVLERALGSERAAEITGRLSAVIEMRPFEFLHRTPPEQIHAFLRNEAPQTKALIISSLHTTLAAEVLALLEEAEQADVSLRIARMSETSPAVIREVETVMRQKLSNVLSEEYATSGGVKSLADILNHADRPTERNVLDTLAESDEELAEEIRALLFVFEDIVKLDDRAVQTVLKDVDDADLALALRGVAEEVRQKVLDNMSERRAEMLVEEIEYQPPQRKSVVEEAQGRIVAEIRRLEDAGEIMMGRRGNDELVV
ncbi:MAG TPA: flagellar motor switch protein FliG [Solirubrobacterales bacterium]|nr:flagellar motor switch protein FliG [Solirubrobacterales bacterium]